MTDLTIRPIKVEDGFISWLEPTNGERTVLDLMKVEAITHLPHNERPTMKTGSGQYYPPISYEEAMGIWSNAARNAPRKVGFGAP